MKKILSGILLCLLASGVLHAGVYEYDYHFSQPRMQQKDGHMIVRLSGCRQTGITGEPQMPAYPLMILLPKGEALDSVEVLKGPGTDYPVMLPVMPKQADRPLSMRTPEKTFLKHQEAYEKSEYAVREMESAVHRFRGANVLTGVIRPLRYFPRSGMLRLTEKMTLRIHTRPDPAGLPEHKAPAMLKTLVQNPGMLSTYPAEGGGAERMLIITSNAFSSALDVLREHYRKYGIETELVSKEDILLGDISGRDLQERIRNTIREQYREEGLDYVLLGGDSDIVPHRGLSCTVNSGGEIISSRNIPADLYYAALDGSWDDNRNSVFGEYNDTTGYDEADLLPELAVGRMPAANSTELRNLIKKSMTYQEAPVLKDLDKHLFFGEFLYDNPESWGSDYLELLIGECDDNGYVTQGVPERMRITKWYDRDSTDHWDKATVKRELAEGQAFLHHDGHANTNYLMKFTTAEVHDSDFTEVNGVENVNPLIYTHGCNCGGFDSPDCIGSRLVNSPVIAAGGVFNSRYGWFNEGTTDGPSVHLHREFMNAIYGLEIFPLGQVHMVSKLATAPWVTAEGQHEQNALRWNYYTNNVLGDPAMRIYSDVPQPVHVQYDLSGIAEHILRATVSRGEAVPAANAGIAVLNEAGDRIGSAVSGTEGFAEIPLNEAVSAGDSLFCFVRGGNILPADTVLEVTGTQVRGLADSYRLSIYPNPFNPAATVRYRVPEAGALEIILFNLQGRRVQTLYRGYRQAGEYQLTLRAGHLPSGVYLCRLQSGNCSVAKKLLLLK